MRYPGKQELFSVKHLMQFVDAEDERDEEDVLDQRIDLLNQKIRMGRRQVRDGKWGKAVLAEVEVVNHSV